MSPLTRREFLGSSLLVAGGAPALAASGERGGCVTQVEAGPPLASATAANPLVVDVHAHMNDPAALQDRGLWRRSQTLYDGFKIIYDGNGEPHPRPARVYQNLEQLIQQMDEGGVDITLVQSGREELLRQIQQRNPRLVGILSASSLLDNFRAPQMIKRAVKEWGCKGIKLGPPYSHFYPTDTRLYPIYRKAIELGIAVIFHTGWAPRDTAQLEYGRPVHLDKVGMEFPEMKVLLAHMGFPWIDECVVVAGKTPNFFVDFSSWCTYPLRYLVQGLDLCRHIIGLGRVLFGTEQNLCNPGHFVQLVGNINRFVDRYNVKPFPADELSGVLGENAMRLFGLQYKRA